MGCRPGAGRRGGRTPPDWLARPPPRTRSREGRGGPPRKRRRGRRRPGRACGRTRPRRAHPPSALRARRRARGAHGRRPRCGRGNGRDGSPPSRRGSRRARQLQGFSGKLLSFPDIPGKVRRSSRASPPGAAGTDPSCYPGRGVASIPGAGSGQGRAVPGRRRRRRQTQPSERRVQGGRTASGFKQKPPGLEVQRRLKLRDHKLEWKSGGFRPSGTEDTKEKPRRKAILPFAGAMPARERPSGRPRVP